MKKLKLEDRIVNYLKDNASNGSQSLWTIVNALYDNCMNKSQAGNGIKVANVRMAAYKSDKLSYYISSTEEGRVCINESFNVTIPWLKEFYKDSLNAHKAKDIYPVVSGIKELFANKEYTKVDTILLHIELTRLSHTAMVAFISASYPARDKLEHWHSCVEKIKRTLIIDEMDYKKILHGFI
jgi:carboxylesterase type B